MDVVLPRRTSPVQESGRAGLGWAVLLSPLVLAGCVSLNPVAKKAEKPCPPVCQIAATWEKEVRFVPDPTHGGAPTPGLVGRLYLWGPESGYPFIGDGSVAVDLYDDTPVGSGGQPRLIEKWNIDPATLKRLARKDMIGEGYTLFLPWGTYRPDLDQVHLMVAYSPQKGTPFYSQSSPLHMNHGVPPTQVTNRTVTPGVSPPAAPAPAPAVAQASSSAAPPTGSGVQQAAFSSGLRTEVKPVDSSASPGDPSRKSSVIVQRVTWQSTSR